LIERHGRFAGMLELGAGFNSEFTGRENVMLSALAIGLTEAQIKERFQSIEEFAEIGDFMDVAVKTYSSGMYARLAFAVAAHVDADMLIVDEILSVGDIAFAHKCMRFIRSFCKRGTLLFVSHSPDAVLSLCDRAVWLDGGEVRAIGTPKEICRDYIAAVDRGKDNSPSFRIGGRRQVAPRQTESSTAATPPPGKILVSSFDPESSWHGRRGASVLNVRVLDTVGNPVRLPSAGDEIVIEIVCEAHTELRNVFIGFILRDRLGQKIFGENTHLTHPDSPISLVPGERCIARFRFQLPRLPDGEYLINTAISEGIQQEHVHHHWLDEAVVLQVRAYGDIWGLCGIPMLSVEIEKIGAAASSVVDADIKAG